MLEPLITATANNFLIGRFPPAQQLTNDSHPLI